MGAHPIKVSAVMSVSLIPMSCSYAVLIDGEDKKSGSLFEDFDPSVNPAEEIDDPEDQKPSDWVENPKYAPLPQPACNAT